MSVDKYPVGRRWFNSTCGLRWDHEGTHYDAMKRRHWTGPVMRWDEFEPGAAKIKPAEYRMEPFALPAPYISPITAEQMAVDYYARQGVEMALGSVNRAGQISMIHRDALDSVYWQMMDTFDEHFMAILGLDYRGDW